MHYYQFNIGDYKSHTEHLTEFEDLAYRRMLDWYYTHETPLPLDVEEIARVIRMRSHCDCIAVVLREFFERTADGWRNHRADKEIAKTGEKSSKAKASAKARWEKKPSKNKDLHVNADVMRTHSEGNANAMLHKTHNTEHKTQNTSKEPRKRSAESFEIEVFAPGLDVPSWDRWQKYRKQIGKPLKPASINAAQIALAKFGVQQADVVEQSIAAGWQGLFAVKGGSANANKQTALEERNKAVGDEWLREQGVFDARS